MWRNVAAPGADLVTPTPDAGSWISSVCLYLAAGSHAVAVVTVMTNLSSAMPSQAWRTPAGGLWGDTTPVHFRYRWWSDDPADFYGYVASSRVMGDENDARYSGRTLVPVEYTCVGASMVMQSHVNRLWQDATCSYMARTIAQDNGLAPWVETTDQHFGQRMQAGSDWQFLVDLACRCGYRLYLDGTSLHFVRESTYLPSSDNSVPQFWMRKSPGVIDSLRRFVGTMGDTDPTGGVRARMTTTAVNAVSGNLSTAAYTAPRTDRLGRPVTPLLTRQYSDYPASSYADGQQQLANAAPFLWVQASAVTNGDSRLKPGALVDLRGDGISDTHQGLWMVIDATHSLDINHFQSAATDYHTTLTLGRNNASSLDLPTQTFGQATNAGAVLMGNTWRAVTVGSI